MISIIVAQDSNRAIGKDNKIPWRLRNDAIRFKSLVMGRVVILGRKTYDSMAWYYDKSGRTMPAKLYIIVSRQKNYQPARANTLVVGSLDQAIKEAQKLSPEVFVIGGAQIYEQAMLLADRLYITEVAAEVDGDTFFPEIDPQTWVEMTRERHHKNKDHTHDYDFVVYDKASR